MRSTALDLVARTIDRVERGDRLEREHAKKGS
jgi:hypothetical protein